VVHGPGRQSESITYKRWGAQPLYKAAPSQHRHRTYLLRRTSSTACRCILGNALPALRRTLLITWCYHHILLPNTWQKRRTLLITWCYHHILLPNTWQKLHPSVPHLLFVSTPICARCSEQGDATAEGRRLENPGFWVDLCLLLQLKLQLQLPLLLLMLLLLLLLLLLRLRLLGLLLWLIFGCNFN